jgi:hypothetical protein
MRLPHPRPFSEGAYHGRVQATNKRSRYPQPKSPPLQNARVGQPQFLDGCLNRRGERWASHLRFIFASQSLRSIIPLWADDPPEPKRRRVMDWLNPVEWAAYLYGTLFQHHVVLGGIVVGGVCAAIGLAVWIRGVDKYREEHGNSQNRRPWCRLRRLPVQEVPRPRPRPKRHCRSQRRRCSPGERGRISPARVGRP